MSLHTTINALAEQFAHDILRALRGASLDDIIAETATAHRRATPKRARRSPDEEALAKVVALLQSRGERGTGMQTRAIQAALRLDERELTRVLKMGLEKKALTRRYGYWKAPTAN